MNLRNLKLKSIWRINLYPVFLFFAFLVWCYSFRGFLSGNLALQSDALAYYEHFKYFIDQMMRGIYPMWDPTMNCGIPQEFFLRRIGSFNPLYFLIILFRWFGMPHMNAYLIFLAVYFWIGMIGYFKLAVAVLNDQKMAFAAYLILMFSSLGTRLFDSYIMLTFVPMVWFFYFFIAFSKHRKRHLFLGMTFTAMLLFTTYIPFYFVTVLLSFIVFYAVFYFRKFKKNILADWNFFLKNKVFVLLCLLVFAASLIPGALLFKEAKKGAFELNYRHSTLKTQNSIEVDPEWNKWAAMEDLSFSAYLTSLKKMGFAIVYFPIFAYIIFAFGVIARLNKKILFLFLWGGFIFLLGSPDLTGVYSFLYNHIPYFKYFRNLHFFLWIVLMPVSVLFLIEQFKGVLQLKPRSKLELLFLYLFIFFVHGAVLLFFMNRGQDILSTYVAWVLSLFFFIFYFSGRLMLRRTAFLILLLTVAASQSVEVFHYLQKNSEVRKGGYRYDDKYFNLNIRSRQENPQSFVPSFNTVFPLTNFHLPELQRPGANYFDVKWTAYLFHNLNRDILDYYRSHSFYVFDRVEKTENEDLVLEKFAKIIVEGRNLAFVFPDKNYIEDKQNAFIVSNPNFDIIGQESNQVKALTLKSNSLTVKTDFPHSRFLIYNDSYYDGWQVFINKQKKVLYRANIAFKGVWVPEGKNIVEFRFGYWWQYLINYGLLFLFYGIFVYLIFLWIKDVHYIKSINQLMKKWVKAGI